jgi:hypothetical protein
MNGDHRVRRPEWAALNGAVEFSAPEPLAVERGEAADPHAAGLDAFARRRPLQRARADLERLRGSVAASTSVMLAWSLFEAPWEIDLNSGREQAAAVIAAKAMLLVIGGLSLRGRRWASYLLLFVCLTSLFAITPELPAEYTRAPWLAFLSSVELVAKLTVMALLAVYLRFKLASKTPITR